MPVATATMVHEWMAALFNTPGRARLDAVLDVGFRRDGIHRVARTEVLLTGWGSPLVDLAALDAMPRLRAILHAGGTVRGIGAPEVLESGGLVTSAADANAIPVAEYTLATILLANKRAATAARRFARTGDLKSARAGALGNFGAVVGVVGASRIGRRVLQLLAPFDLEVLLHDPTVAHGEGLPARLVGLDGLLSSSDVVSLHAPLLPQTAGMIGRRELALLRRGATLINTARGGLVDHTALAEAVVERDLHAVLDVTDPEPLPADHALWTVDSVVLTPHLAGARGNEVQRLGAAVVAEAERLVRGLPPLAPVLLEEMTTRA